MKIDCGTVTIERHVATGNGVPFAPRHVYWVRAQQEGLRERRTTVYSLTVAVRLAEEQVRIWQELSEMAFRELTAHAPWNNKQPQTPLAFL